MVTWFYKNQVKTSLGIYGASINNGLVPISAYKINQKKDICHNSFSFEKITDFHPTFTPKFSNSPHFIFEVMQVKSIF